MLKKLLSIALLTFVLISQVACGSLAGRVAKAVGSIPSVVRVLFPNADANLLSVLDAAGAAFKEFTENKTATNWQKAEMAWDRAKPLLAQLGNDRIRQIVAVVDLLIRQVTVPVGITGSMGGADTSSNEVKVRFKESDVKRLEALVK